MVSPSTHVATRFLHLRHFCIRCQKGIAF
ncbi:hypothetical protein GQ600_1079 [Phytophthora cactorum]|nr:hypothetical protein GQ600_1079 [Phytophthora cactorum]